MSVNERQPAGINSIEAVLTAGCNLSCSYCYQQRNQRARINWPTLREAVDLILTSPEPEVSIGFCGGEPLLELELIHRAVAHAEANRRAGQRVRYGLVTNGTLLDEDSAAFLAAHGFSTQISFDGVAAAQDLRLAGSFARLDELLTGLREKQPEFFEQNLAISLTVLPSTFKHLPESLQYFHAKEVREILLSPLFTDSAEWHCDQIADLGRVFDDLCLTSLDHYQKTGRVPLESLRPRDTQTESAVRSRPLCTVGRPRNLAIDTNGEVYGCVLFAESVQRFSTPLLRDRIPTLRLGRLADREFADRLSAYPLAVRSAEIFEQFERKYSAYRRCGDCDHLATCEICPLSIGHSPGNDDPHRIPDFLCAFSLVTHKYREVFQHRVRAGETVAEGAAAMLETLRASRRHLEGLVADLGSAAEH